MAPVALLYVATSSCHCPTATSSTELTPVWVAPPFPLKPNWNLVPVELRAKRYSAGPEACHFAMIPMKGAALVILTQQARVKLRPVMDRAALSAMVKHCDEAEAKDAALPCLPATEPGAFTGV